MRKALIFFIIIFLSSSFITNSQISDLYVPLNIQKAIEKGSRSNNGMPGENYWQNSSDYSIKASVNPESGYLVGEESITYYNNSPDSLNRIVIRLYQDISKPSAIRDWYVNEKGLNSGMKLNYLIIENDTLDVSEESKDVIRMSTNLIIKLKQNIIPNSKLQIHIGWEFEIPKIFKPRTGNYGNGNMYVAYWYPQISVYDDIDGWDYIDYSGSVEFYNDFSNYDFTISVPKGTVIWATGELQNGTEVFRNDILEKYEKAKISDKTISIITKKDYEKGLITTNEDTLFWKFNATNVPAIAFATSKNLLWDGTSLIVDKQTNRRALADVIYNEGDVHYENGAQYSKTSLEYLSFELPGYPYPYSHATAYCNGGYGGGMESPMMANNGAPKLLANHVGLLFHEISHNYFPFFMGTNERKYAWMDEGWASFLTTDVVEIFDEDYNYEERNISSYTNRAGTERDLPLMVPSFSYKVNARTGFYTKPANAYSELQEYLGEQLFKKCLLEYVRRWNGKHPIPHDFFLTFNDVANEDLSWFWKPWFYEFGYPDLAVTDIQKVDNTYSIIISKIGNLPTRLFVKIEFKDSTNEIIEKPASVWKKGVDEFKITLNKNKIIKRVLVGNSLIPDVNQNNNILDY